MDAAAVSDVLRRAAPAARADVVPSIDMPAIAVDRDHLLDAARVLRDDPALQFTFLADITAVDLLPAEPRYEVVYHMACLGGSLPAARLRVKVRVPGSDPRLPSVVPVWPVAGWLEREVFDLFGLTFEGHPDLRRVLMPDDWEGYPLRKDYPVQVRKDTASWSPIQLSPEEFAANVRAVHEQARVRAAEQRPGGPGPAAGAGQAGNRRRD
jgi:NADH-quinone oxidoreductase subunit C